MNEHLCEKCGKNFASKQSLKIHSQTSNCLKQKDKITKNCEFCNKIFSSKQMLQYHYTSCTEKKLYLLRIEYDEKIKKLTTEVELSLKMNETLHKALDTNMLNLAELCKVCNRYCINNKNLSFNPSIQKEKEDGQSNRTSGIFSSNSSICSMDIEDMRI
jgi:hypothetical protein